MSQAIEKINDMLSSSSFNGLFCTGESFDVFPSGYAKSICESLGFESVYIRENGRFGDMIYFAREGVEVALSFDADVHECIEYGDKWHGKEGVVCIRMTFGDPADEDEVVEIVKAESKTEGQILAEVLEVIKNNCDHAGR